MPTNLKATLNVKLGATYKNLLDIATPTTAFENQTLIELANGTGAGQADLMFSDTRTLAASASESLDLAGSLVGDFGATLTFVELKLVLVKASASNTNAVRLTRPASNGVPLFLAASDGIDIAPGGCFLWAAPTDGFCTVTASTGDLLSFANSSSGTSVTYDVVFVGASA